jgi:hypothetical protein
MLVMINTPAPAAFDAIASGWSRVMRSAQHVAIALI